VVSITSDSSSTYQPGLPIPALIAMVGGLLTEQRTAEGLICRYLADLSDRIQEGWRAPCGPTADTYDFTDVYEAAHACFGMTARQARERVRVGRALRALPRIEAALREGKVVYGRVREISRVATPDTEVEWLRLAQELPFSTLERQVAATSSTGGAAFDQKASRPRCFQWTGPDTVELRIALRADQWTVIYRALEAARRSADGIRGDAEALVAVAREALAQHPALGSTDPSGLNDPTRTGSLVGPLDDLIGPECIQVLTTMGTRGGWHVDSLVEATGLRIEEVSRAVMLLEIQGKLRNDFGLYQVA
jgi:hypothetical protein